MRNFKQIKRTGESLQNLAILIMVFVLNVGLASAADLTVNSLADNTTGSDGLVTLREAIIAANADGTTDLGDTGSGPDRIIFDPSLSGQINLLTIGDTTAGPSALSITSTVTIEGDNGSTGIIISRDGGAPNMRLFYVDASGALTLQNVTLNNGMAVGGNGGNGALNDGGGGGGGAGLGGAVFNAGTLNLTQSTVSGNSVRGGNGGIGSPNGVGDDGGGGGGGGLGGSGGSGSQSGQFAGGEGGGGGGGVLGNGGSVSTETGDGGGGGGGDQADGASTTTGTGGAGGVSNGGGGGSTSGANNGTDGGPGGGGGGGSKQSGVAGNGGNGGFGGGGGGSGEHDSSGSANAGNGGFGGGGGGGGEDGNGGNGGFGGGGGGASDDPTAPVEVSGTGGFGAGDGGPITAGGSISGGGGGGAGHGGGIFNFGGTVTITNSTLSGNTAVGGSGGVGTNSAQDGSDGQGFGGAIFNRNGTVTLSNSTISGNTADAGGGGIYNLGDGATATLTINNSIVSDTANAASDMETSSINAGVDTVSGNNNLIEDPNGHPFTNGINGNIVGLDPVLGGLTDNGGLTQTHLPDLASSPVIDASNNGEATDQRGLPRPSGAGFDIGAVELQTGPFGGDVSGVFLKKFLVASIFQNPANDHIRVVGIIDLDSAPLPRGTPYPFEGAVVNIDIGGTVLNYTLDAKGRAGKAFRAKYLRKKNQIKFQLNGNDGFYQGNFTDEGMTNVTAKNSPLVINMDFDLNGLTFNADIPVAYHAKAGRTGKALAKKYTIPE